MKTKVDTNGILHIETFIEAQHQLTDNDIYNWLSNCSNPSTLRRIGNAAIRFAMSLENENDDDFRSRA